MRSVTQEGLLGLFLIVMISVGIFATYAGYSVSGIQYEISSEAPGILGVIEWVWDSILFLFHLALLQVDGVPVFVSVIFDFIAMMSIFIIVKIVRGGGS